MIVWSLQSKQGYAHRHGHPWVFSNQLQKSPKGLPPGELIELRDERGQFISRGYGHPNALICYRELSRDHNVSDLLTVDFFVRYLKRAWLLREQLGLVTSSFRWVFAEGDFLPGLVIDRFLQPDDHQTLVVQISTSGMARVQAEILQAIKEIYKERNFSWAQTTVILASNSSRRTLEGLPIVDPEVAHGPTPASAFFMSYGDTSIKLHTDFLSGQKTGFFLDQRSNVTLALQYLRPQMKRSREPLRVLDLCCYVGQWATAVANLAQNFGRPCEITLVDASEHALQLAKRNILDSAQGHIQTLKSDVLSGLPELNEKKFDVIICDPPAFVKKRKDLQQGMIAYQKLNRTAMGLATHRALYISCSCSHLLSTADFQEVLAAGARKSRKQFQWFAQGSQSLDHPARMEFPEGQYLKCWLGISS